MSDTSPVIREGDFEVVVFFPTLKIVGSFGGETEAATRKRKIGKPKVACEDSRH